MTEYTPSDAHRPVTVIISDTHLGAGPDDPLEDHVCKGRPLTRFIEQLAAGDDGAAGEIELVINGDFLEFVQALPEAFTPVSKDHFCTEDESLAKLEAILDGHASIFRALKAFQEAGNSVTVMAGNHDVDLFWPRVQARLRDRIGSIYFELGQDWYSRYGGRLRVAHGHQLDPANRFEDWHHPIGVAAGRSRLSSCPGTRFVVGFINPMDARFPFVDNIKPYSTLIKVLMRDDLAGGMWACGALMRFLWQDGGALLGAEVSDPSDPREHILMALAQHDGFAAEVSVVASQLEGKPVTVDSLRRRLMATADLDRFLDELLHAGLFLDLPPVPQNTEAVGTLSASDGDDGAGLLGLAQERMVNVVEELRAAARERASEGAQVVVCGHTHIPDEIRRTRWSYFNTGSWTHYLRVEDNAPLTLEDLKVADRFPYELWYVEVREGEGGNLEAGRHLFESSSST